jgi:predicted nucleotidyltransferase
MIDPARREKIQAELDAIERDYGERILHAIESGSRAWGFPSADSDYDVRIIYAHPRDWYLSVREQRDVIEKPISGDLDIGGWDLRKTLKLMAGGNAVVHEWLGSPIVYRQSAADMEMLTDLARQAFDPRAAFYHYFAMSAKKLDVAAGEAVTAKRVLYGMRTLLCARWVTDSGTAPPMMFRDLLNRYTVASSEVRSGIDQLVRIKAGGFEADLDTTLGPLLAWAQVMVAEVRQISPPAESRVSGEYLDKVFINLLR